MKATGVLRLLLFFPLLLPSGCTAVEPSGEAPRGKTGGSHVDDNAGPVLSENEELLDCGLEQAALVPGPLMRVGLMVELTGTCLKAGIGGKCDAMLAAAAESAVSIREFWDRQGALLLVSTAYAEAGRFDDAFGICEKIEKVDFKASALTLAAVKARGAGREELADGMLAAAVSLGLVMANDFARERTLMGIVQDLAAAGEYDHALAAAAMMEDGYLKDCALEEIACRQVDEGQYGRAGKIIRAASRAEHVVRVLHAMAESQIEEGRKSMASSTLAVLVREAGKLEMKEDTLMWLVKAAGGYIELGRKEKAVDLLSKAHAGAKGIRNERLKVGILAAAAEALGQAGRKHKAGKALMDALAVAQRQEADVFRDMLLSRIAAAHAAIGEKAGAMSLIETMGDGTIVGNAVFDLAVQYAREGSYEDAMMVALSLAEQDNRAAALSVIAAGLLAGGRADLAHAAARLMDDGSEKAEALLAVAKAFLEGGGTGKPGAVLEEAAAAAAGVFDGPTRDDIMTRIVLMFFDGGMRGPGLDVLERAGPAVKASVLGRLVEAGNLPDGFALEIIGRLSCGHGGHGRNVL
ncbi:MAG: hypothetical protein ABIJ56_16205 [Pseudomonadota bacterium]